jgi:hypothetical protein
MKEKTILLSLIDLNNINFQSSGRFCEILIHYKVIHDCSTINHLKNDPY